ncbi:hypothetical protein GQ53DRAFT_426636 [Thozetella sp. PMI_491]|nr:hypothetical protein GQ53DRAFT_426636 [Thozetella sp. PMI_491]
MWFRNRHIGDCAARTLGLLVQYRRGLTILMGPASFSIATLRPALWPCASHLHRGSRWPCSMCLQSACSGKLRLGIQGDKELPGSKDSRVSCGVWHYACVVRAYCLVLDPARQLSCSSITSVRQRGPMRTTSTRRRPNAGRTPAKHWLPNRVSMQQALLLVAATLPCMFLTRES